MSPSLQVTLSQGMGMTSVSDKSELALWKVLMELTLPFSDMVDWGSNISLSVKDKYISFTG